MESFACVSCIKYKNSPRARGGAICSSCVEYQCTK